MSTIIENLVLCGAFGALGVVALGLLIFVAYKFVVKPIKAKKEKNNLFKVTLFEDLKRKGIMTHTTKKDKKALVKKAKRELRKATRDQKLTKEAERLNKKFS